MNDPILFDYTVHSAYLSDNVELDPIDYIYCKSRDELYNAVSANISTRCSSEMGTVQPDDYTLNLSIPEEFYVEWERLKCTEKNRTYSCQIVEEIYAASIESTHNLAPCDYLYCESEEELREEVYEDLLDYPNYGNVEVYDGETKVNIPDEFIQEWKFLKGI